MRDYLIINNPFHILSISASASMIEVENAFKNMMSCIDKGQSISGCRFDICDFSELDRSTENLVKCKEKLLESATSHRMYWFDKSEYTKTWNNPLYTNDFLEAISSGPTPSNYDDFLALVLFWTSFYGNPFLWERIGLALFKYVYDMRNNNMSNIILSSREGREVTDGDDYRKQLLKVLIYTTSDNQDNAYVRKLCGELYSTEWFQDEVGLSPSKAKKYAIIEYCQAMIYEKDNPDFFTAGNVLELEEKLPSIIWKALAFRFLEFKLSSWTYVYDELVVKHDIGYEIDRQIVEKVEARVGKPKKQYLIDEYRKAIASCEIYERIEEFETYIKLTTEDETIDFDSIFQDKYDDTDVDSGWVDIRSPKEKYKEACELLNNGHKERALEILLNLQKEGFQDYVRCKLGDIYSKIDSYQAQIWYLGAALSGNAKAMQLLAMSYETDGYYKEAAEFYLKGAEHNKGFCKKCLLRMCIQGRWKPENPGIFLSWYETDAKKGKVVAQRSMGDIYWYGFGVESNKNIALDWYMTAAKAGDEYSMDRLLYFVSEKMIIKEEYQHMIANIILSNASYGSAAGAYVCGDVLHSTYLKEKDIELKNLAISFYEISAAKGCKFAKKELEDLEKQGEYRPRSIKHLKKYSPQTQMVTKSDVIRDRNVTGEAKYMDKALMYLRNIFGIKAKGNLFGIGDVQVTNIRCYPISISTREVLYETREKYTFKEQIEDISKEYEPVKLNNLWEHNIGSVPIVFGKTKQRTKIQGTSNIYRCDACEGRSMVACECGGKKTTCAKCSGKGTIVCSTCNGMGSYKCGSCRGKGYTERYVYYDNNQRGYTVRDTCYECNGTGVFQCISCYNSEHGSGIVSCDRCDGYGINVCRKCTGRGIVKCVPCAGKGKVRIGNGIEQSFDVDRVGVFIKGYDVDESIYGERGFGRPEYNVNKDKLILSYVSDSFIGAVPYSDEMPEFPLANTFTYYNMYMLLKEYYNKYKDKDDTRIVRYGCSFYQREVMEIKFIYKGKTHYCQIDELNNSYILDKTLEM